MRPGSWRDKRRESHTPHRRPQTTEGGASPRKRFQVSPKRDDTGASVEFQYWNPKSQVLVKVNLRRFEVCRIVVVFCTLIFSFANPQPGQVSALTFLFKLLLGAEGR